MKFLQKLTNDKKNSHDNFMKNKYKYKDVKSKSFGKFKNGTLMVSKKEFNKIKSF